MVYASAGKHAYRAMVTLLLAALIRETASGELPAQKVMCLRPGLEHQAVAHGQSNLIRTYLSCGINSLQRNRLVPSGLEIPPPLPLVHSWPFNGLDAVAPRERNRVGPPPFSQDNDRTLLYRQAPCACASCRNHHRLSPGRSQCARCFRVPPTRLPARQDPPPLSLIHAKCLWPPHGHSSSESLFRDCVGTHQGSLSSCWNRSRG